MGRPKIPKDRRKDIVVQVRLDSVLSSAVDNFIRQQENPEINRSAAVRMLLRQALAC